MTENAKSQFEIIRYSIKTIVKNGKRTGEAEETIKIKCRKCNFVTQYQLIIVDSQKINIISSLIKKIISSLVKKSHQCTIDKPKKLRT